jgi:hypothetical protein
LLVESTASRDDGVGDGQKDDLDELDTNNLGLLAGPHHISDNAYIVLVGALKVNHGVEQLTQNCKNSFILVQRLETSEEAKKLLELLPLASVKRLLCTIADTLHGLDGNLGLDLVPVKRDGCDERNLEGLLDESSLSQQSFLVEHFQPTHSCTQTSKKSDRSLSSSKFSAKILAISIASSCGSLVELAMFKRSRRSLGNGGSS